jgi:hygromycin-B 4-O-kinase
MKTTLDLGTVRAILRDIVGPITNLAPMVEGEESQAFSFGANGQAYVLRINRTLAGFRQDARAARHFASDALPIPAVVQLGMIDVAHAFCITEKAPGLTLQDAEEGAITRALEPLTRSWRAMQAVDVRGSDGYGKIADDGNAPFESWSAYLLSIVDADSHPRHRIAGMDRRLLQALSDEFRRLVPLCPAERKLVHGDFGANNVLIDADTGAITAVLDWECALYGDPLFDIAGAYFWRTWLRCMERAAAYWENVLGAMPQYRERLTCYQLCIGLWEIYTNAVDNNAAMVDWLQRRCRSLLSEIGERNP